MTRTNHRHPDAIAVALPAPGHGKKQRVVSYFDPWMFEMIREIAVARGVGVGAVVREWAEDRVADVAGRGPA